MKDRFNKYSQSRERIQKVIGEEIRDRIRDVFSDALNPENLLRIIAGMGIDLSKISGLARQQDIDDPYKILGLDKSASNEELKTRYREMLKRLHPDTADIDGTEELCRKVIFAYRQILQERGLE